MVKQSSNTYKHLACCCERAHATAINSYPHIQNFQGQTTQLSSSTVQQHPSKNLGTKPFLSFSTAERFAAFTSKMSRNIKIPTSPADITSNWIQEITGDNCDPNSISVESDIQEGIGFLSSTCRVSYKTLPKNETKSIIVKLLPKKPEYLSMVLADNTDEREILFYSQIAPDLLEITPSLQKHICICYHAQIIKQNPALNISRDSIVVMEDLKLTGYKMMEIAGSETETVTNSLLSFLAQLHFSAHAVSARRNKSLDKLYPFLQGINENRAWEVEIETMFEEAYPNFKNLMTSFNLEHVYKEFERLIPYTTEIIKMVEQSGRKNPCLIHADIWPPNIMVNDKLPVKILDWQLMGYRDVAFDLSIMLFTVLPKDLFTKQYLSKCLKVYWLEFEELCDKDPEYKEKIPRKSWEDFETYFFSWGAAFAYLMMIPGFIEAYQKDWPKFINVFRVMCEEMKMCEFLLKECTK